MKENTMRKLFLAALSLLWATAAVAQSPVRQSGTVTPRHVAVWSTTGVIQDGGTAANPFLTSLGVVANGPGICQNSAATTGPYNRLCLSVSTASAAQITLDAIGGAVAQDFQIVLNGTTYTFPFSGSGSGNVVGPNSSTINGFAAFNSTNGQLLKQSTDLVDVSGAIGVNTATPGSTSVASGFACPATGALNGCFDVGGVLVLNAQQQAYYAYGAFASTAYFSDFGSGKWGYAIGNLDNNTFGILYTTDSFGAATVETQVWTPTWTYLTNLSAAATNPSFNLGLAIGWNFSSTGGETNFINNTMNLGTKDFVFSDWNGATKLDLLTLSKDVAGGAALFGASYPNAANIGQINVNAGNNNTVFVAGSSVSHTNMATYYLSPVMFYQLTNNTVNNIFCEDFRSANVGGNSFAAMCAQITDVTGSAVSGTLTFLTANSSSIASRALTINASGGVWVGSSNTDPGANSIGATGSITAQVALNAGTVVSAGTAMIAGTSIAATTFVSVGTKIRATGTAPALTSCGTSPAIVGSDLAGEVTMGTGTPTGCIITFAAAYSSAPFCTVAWQATPLASQSYAVSTTAITLTQTATSSNKANYTCVARSAG